MKPNNDQITALYCRLSQEDAREGESLSIENQKKMLSEYAERNSFRNCHYYIDDGYSGVSSNRPDYQRMLKDVENGLVGTVIVKDQSRLSRNYLEAGRLMDLLFPAYDVRFIAITDAVDSAEGSNDWSGLKNYLNDFYARDTSKKIRAVQRAKGERGERVGATIAYGYMKDPNDSKHIVPDPETAPIIKRIFEMYASGKGIKKICAELEKDEVLSPSVYAFRKTGSRAGNPKLDKPYAWTIRTVRNMLSNQIYCGDTVNFKTYTKSYKLKKRIKNSPENMRVFKDTHEAIIDRVTFDLVQRHFSGRKRADKRGDMDKYAGYLYCAECGSRLYLHHGKTSKDNSFRCGHYESRKSDCTMHYIRESVIDAVVLQSLKKVTTYAREHSDEFFNMAMSNGEKEAKEQFKDSEKLRDEYESRIKQLETAISMLYMDRVTGRVSPERYDSLSAGYEKEQSDLKTKLDELDSKASAVKVREQCIREFIANAKENVNITKVTPELLRTFIKRIEVYEKPEKYARNCTNRITIDFTFTTTNAFEVDGIIIGTEKLINAA